MELNLLSIFRVSLFRRFFVYSNFVRKYRRIIEFSHDIRFKFSIFFFFCNTNKKVELFLKVSNQYEFYHFVID